MSDLVSCNSSASIINLATALAKAQGEFPEIP
jgi:hypothetical protein